MKEMIIIIAYNSYLPIMDEINKSNNTSNFHGATVHQKGELSTLYKNT